MDIKIDSTGHIDITSGVLSLVVDRDLLVAQRLSVRLRTYLGEWFMDLAMGIAWFSDVLLKNISKQAVDAILQNEINKDMFVSHIIKFSSTVVNRNYSCEFEVKIIGLSTPIVITYLADENNFYVTDENGNLLSLTT